MNSVLNMADFDKYFSDKDLDKGAVAQHVVIRGTKVMYNVFKYGVDSVFKPEELALMNKAVFTNDELDITQYEPEEHQED